MVKFFKFLLANFLWLSAIHLTTNFAYFQYFFFCLLFATCTRFIKNWVFINLFAHSQNSIRNCRNGTLSWQKSRDFMLQIAYITKITHKLPATLSFYLSFDAYFHQLHLLYIVSMMYNASIEAFMDARLFLMVWYKKIQSSAVSEISL